MGQAGVQREPSMEEILASIRRIIENNEPEEGENPTRFDDTGTFEDAGDQRSDDDLTSDHAATETASPPAAAGNETDFEPVSLADVAARARLAVQAPEAEDAAADTEADTDTEMEETGSLPDDLTEMDDAAAEELRAALTSDEPVEAPVLKMMVSASLEQEEPKEKPDVNRSEPVAATHQPEGAGQLVSLQTGEKVAASFGELDAAIAAGQRRSFDEIAEEMLRPMLTQWLDDNLPTLVERLVREEIERVSRGNRG
ncbi:hypothetical protein IMCC20628_01756 [Hoeflea sp. IMCC20628]|uniref:PopZ family protein n=1 Tax=Hoeflea sp. IMCC20628 TaxID=1620421 RepID=UPI00063ABC24|nr:DUF2497 domain-containing protein [Hoeflea sp. IMCC20628]AKI00467.1 hypothetical protein IMCC20628_01756 [Hoeflea sp. IMCC20628]